MQVVVTVLAGLLGLVTGSFANVPIHRWPRKGTVTVPRRSVCPACAAPVRARDNVPVVSWLLLRGRCRDCGEAFGAQYLVVEVATGVLFAWTAWVWWETPVLLVALLVHAWAMVVATAIDLEFKIIPNRLTYRLPFVLAPLLVAVTLAGDGDGVALRRAAIFGLVVPGVMFAVSELFRLVRGKVGLGMGDVKLALSLGLVLGYLGGAALVAFAYGTIIVAAVVAFALIASGRAKLASRIPFGPYLAVGALLPVLFPAASSAAVRAVFGF